MKTYLYHSELKKVLKLFIKNNWPIMIKGSPGVGKTSLVKSVVNESFPEYNLYIWHPVVKEPTDFKGLPAIVEGEASFLPYGELKKIIAPAHSDNSLHKPSVVFVDDFGQADVSVQKAFMQILYGGNIDGVEISKDVRFIVATNDIDDNSGVGTILEPVKSRFYSIVELKMNHEEWVEWAYNEGTIDRKLIQFVKFKPNIFSNFEPSENLENTVTPRTLHLAGQILREFQGKEDDPILLPLIMGSIGSKWGAELYSFLSVYKEIPDTRELLDNPDIYDSKISEKAKNNLSILYALCDSMVQNSDLKDVDNIYVIVKKFPTSKRAAFLSMITVDLIRKFGSSVASSLEYINWLRENDSILSKFQMRFG